MSVLRGGRAGSHVPALRTKVRNHFGFGISGHGNWKSTFQPRKAPNPQNGLKGFRIFMAWPWDSLVAEGGLERFQRSSLQALHRLCRKVARHLPRDRRSPSAGCRCHVVIATSVCFSTLDRLVGLGLCLPGNSRYGGPAGRVDFWFGQGARASRLHGLSENGRTGVPPRRDVDRPHSPRNRALGGVCWE